MRPDRNTDRDCDVLWRIVAMLFSLAGLADRAAGVCARRRREVLGILLWGEARGWAFAIDMATGGMVSDAPAMAAPEMPDLWDDLPCSCQDAILLAARLRALALVLCVLVSQAWRFAVAGDTGPSTGTRGSVGLPIAGGRSASRWRTAFPAPDTS